MSEPNREQAQALLPSGGIELRIALLSRLVQVRACLRDASLKGQPKPVSKARRRLVAEADELYRRIAGCDIPEGGEGSHAYVWTSMQLDLARRLLADCSGLCEGSGLRPTREAFEVLRKHVRDFHQSVQSNLR